MLTARKKEEVKEEVIDKEVKPISNLTRYEIVERVVEKEGEVIPESKLIKRVLVEWEFV